LPIKDATEVQIKSIPPFNFQFAITIGLRFLSVVGLLGTWVAEFINNTQPANPI